MRNNTLRFRIATWLFIHTPHWLPGLISILLCMVVYPLLTMWMVSCSDDHEWISSFIEVSIALNSAMLVTDLREWFIAKFKAYSKVFAGIVISKIGIQRNDMQLARLNKKMYKTEKPLAERLGKVARLFSFVGFAAIVAGCILLLTDCPKEHMIYISLLMWPFVLFYLFLILQFLWALKVSRKICQELVDDSSHMAIEKMLAAQIDQISKSVPKAEAEE